MKMKAIQHQDKEGRRARDFIPPPLPRGDRK